MVITIEYSQQHYKLPVYAAYTIDGAEYVARDRDVVNFLKDKQACIVEVELGSYAGIPEIISIKEL